MWLKNVKSFRYFSSCKKDWKDLFPNAPVLSFETNLFKAIKNLKKDSIQKFIDWRSCDII